MASVFSSPCVFRSCHKMVLDPVFRQLFVLGRYVERTLRQIQRIALLSLCQLIRVPTGLVYE
jgi:hypothetical protein